MSKDELIREMGDLSLIVFRINRSMAHFGRPHGPHEYPKHHHPPLPHIQMHTLMTVHKHQGATMGALSEQMMMTRQQMTKIIDGLVERQLVERQTDPENRRQVLVTISDQGERYLDEMARRKADRMRRMLDAVEDADVDRLLEAIRTFKDVLGKIEPHLPPR